MAKADLAKKREYQRRWRAANKERVAEYNRRRAECRRRYKKALRAANPRLAAESLKDYFRRNPWKRNEYRAAYTARKKKAAVPLTAAERKRVAAIYKKAKQMTLRTGRAHHVDHIIPLAKGGLHHPDNLQVLTAEQNRRKHAKL